MRKNAIITTAQVVYAWAVAVWESLPALSLLNDVLEAGRRHLSRHVHPWVVATTPAEAPRRQRRRKRISPSAQS